MTATFIHELFDGHQSFRRVQHEDGGRINMVVGLIGCRLTINVTKLFGGLGTYGVSTAVHIRQWCATGDSREVAAFVAARQEGSRASATTETSGTSMSRRRIA